MSSSEQESFAIEPARKRPETRTVRIRELNDRFRTTFVGGQLALTSGVHALSVEVVAIVLSAVRSYTAFGANNDPHGEHDFGSIDIAGERVFWKIDCYDKSLEFNSPDPASVEVTARVLTIMLASEY